MKKLLIALVILGTRLPSRAQNVPVLAHPDQGLKTHEDSLSAGINSSKTVLSGYGSASYQRDFNDRKGAVTLDRAVLFVGHQFDRHWSFFSELEVENAKVEDGKPGGEIAMEQCYLRYNLNSRNYFVAGLYIPRIGLLNENHIPVNFNGVERPIVEQIVIPATWRELGLAWYGQFNHLQLNAGIMNGLDNSTMEHGSGIREGRAEGLLAPANALAVSASAAYHAGDFRYQVSAYAGGTTDVNARQADSLHLDGGAFGTPLYLGEGDMTWSHNGFSAKILGTLIAFPDAAKVNAAYGKNLPEQMYGWYAELGYDLLNLKEWKQSIRPKLIAFARLEMLDLNTRIPEAPLGLYDGTLQQRHLIAGFSFLPIPNLVIKADIRLLHTGDQNPDLVIHPSPNSLAYQPNNHFLNIGIGYSF